MKKSILNKSALTALAFATLFSCGKDDGPEDPINTAPKITVQNFNASEDANDTTVFGKVVATDAEKDALTFSLKTNSNALFEITNTGDISLATGKTLDFETAESHTLSVAVTDGKLTSNAAVTITVVDVDENVAPTIAAQTFSIDENSATNTVIGTVAATDADGDTLTFSSSNLGSLFALSTSGELTVAGDLNFENSASYTISVTANDGQLDATAQIVINVNDVNDAPVIGVTEFTVAEDINETTVIGNVGVTDEDGDNVTTYNINANSFNANGVEFFTIATNGDITLIPGQNLDFETKNLHTISLEVNDGNGGNAIASIAINVTDVLELTATAFSFAGSSQGSAISQFSTPIGVAKGSDGLVYVADRDNSAIKRIDASGTVTVFVGVSVATIPPSSPIPSPRDLAFDSNGNLYVSDTQLHKIMKITPAGNVSTFAGNGTAGYVDGLVSSGNTQFNAPRGIFIDANDNVYVADTGNNAVRKITANGTASTIANTNQAVSFSLIEDVVVTSDGTVYVSDYNDRTIKKLSSSGAISIVAGEPDNSYMDGIGTAAGLNGPSYLTIDANDIIYFTSNRSSTIRRLDTSTGEVNTILASANIHGNVNGVGSMARFRNPLGIWVNSAGTEMFIGDTNNHVIRRVTINQ